MATHALDDAKLSRFHLKTTLYGNGGHLCDGYILGAIVPALPLFAQSHPVSSLMSGLIGASALIGVFLGSVLFGWVTDRIGRRRMFVIDLALFVVLSLAQIAVTGAVMLLVLRVLLGIAVGADYTIATTLVAEFAPRKYRATLLAVGPAMWTIGYVLAIVVGTAIAGFGGDGAWRWILATSAVPALILLVLRRNTPESPRWLARNGRADEGLAILRKHVSPAATLADLADEEEEDESTGSLREVFAEQHRKRLAFACLFWFCQVVPYFAVFTFLPTILESLDIESGFWQTTSVNLFLLIGGAVGIVTIGKIGRRPYTLVSFALLTASTLAIGLWQSAPAGYVIALFALFALISSAMAALDTVYPSELFPTSIRASATGICVSFSRIGAAIGTLLLPMGIDHFGAHGVTLMTGVVAGLGLLISIAWAPETAGLPLAQAAGDTKEGPGKSPTGNPDRSSSFVSQQ
ncbi:MFS transporter [Rhodococcus sp. NCIMB 12038]|uniref:MFS transporter n=1 Tax=Rhodococcus sp. NCIMB 12038 TaxID=933800 RepID=UPI0015C67A21|nr:MFS transporter [Rhodococcus sp. NCIMB 12038]